MFGFQPEGLGQLSPGQRPGYAYWIWQPEGLRYAEQRLSQAFSLEDKSTPYPGRCPGLCCPTPAGSRTRDSRHVAKCQHGTVATKVPALTKRCCSSTVI